MDWAWWRYGARPDWTVVRDDLRRALDGSLHVADLLTAREAAYARSPSVPVAPSTVRLVDGESETATVVEVRAADSLGILHRITGVLDAHGLDVRSAHVSSLGADVVDAFYVPVIEDDSVREAVVRGLLAVLP